MINLISKSSSSTSELVFKLIQGLNVEIDKDIATNLHSGILIATNNFTAYSVNADTFEAIASLLRAGAVKKPMQAPLGGNQFGRSFGGPIGSYGQQRPFNLQPMVNQQQPQSQLKQQQSFEKQSRNISEVEYAPSSPEGQKLSNDTPESFLKPKIFSGSGGLV